MDQNSVTQTPQMPRPPYPAAVWQAVTTLVDALHPGNLADGRPKWEVVRNETPQPDHPAMQVIANPSPWMPAHSFWNWVFYDYFLKGQHVIEVMRPLVADGLPRPTHLISVKLTAVPTLGVDTLQVQNADQTCLLYTSPSPRD